MLDISFLNVFTLLLLTPGIEFVTQKFKIRFLLLIKFKTYPHITVSMT